MIHRTINVTALISGNDPLDCIVYLVYTINLSILQVMSTLQEVMSDELEFYKVQR